VVRALVNGNPVKVWREHRKYSQYELAEMVGISPAYLSKIESGKQDGSVKVQKKIALALDIDLDDINS
jgi:transcriptional regulator with XRE-family HTH domain